MDADMLAELRRMAVAAERSAEANERAAAAVEALLSAKSGGVDDATRGEALAAAASLAFGDVPVTSGDLLEEARTDAVLRLALSAFVDVAAPGAAKSLGRYLAARVAPRRFGPFEIRADADTSTQRDGRAWSFVRL